MTEPLSHPAAWRGDELLRRDDWLRTFSEAANDEIDAALSSVSKLAVEEITSENFQLPTLGPVLAGVQHSLEHGSGAAMLRGLPIESCTEEECRRIFWGLTQHVGTPVSQTAKGERIFSVRDEGFHPEDPRSRGPNTRKKLSFHTDRCDVIAFLCLRPAKSGGKNYVVSSMTLYNEIRTRRPDLLEVLLQPFFYKRHNVDTGNDLPYCQQPIFSFRDGHFAANLLRVLIERAYALPELPDMSPPQREALDYIEELAEDPQLHVELYQESGDILFLNNWVTLHRRSEFVDHEDLALRRHLLRLWLAMPNSRPLDPAFGVNYGSTDAGADRGGMHPPRPKPRP